MNIFALWGMGGLIKSNLTVYFDSIKHGVDHKDALMIVLKSRYPFEPGKIRKVMTELSGVIALNADTDRTILPTEKDELRDLICTMYFVETHLDRADRFTMRMENMKLIDKFNELYDLMAKMGIAPEEYTKNTSGQGKLAIIPKEIRGWNWGAFVFGWIWGWNNLVASGKEASRIAPLRSTKLWLSYLTMIPFVGLIAMVLLGVKGNKWAWQGKKWDSIEHFKRTQRKWAWWALALNVFALAFYIYYAYLLS